MKATANNPLIDDVARADVAASLIRTAFSAILDGRAASRTELIQAAGATPEVFDGLVGRALIVDACDRVVAAHGLSLVPARQHRLTMRGCRFWTRCAIDAVGIPAGLQPDALIETTCVHCASEMRF